jgi:hypothetical protein
LRFYDLECATNRKLACRELRPVTSGELIPITNQMIAIGLNSEEEFDIRVLHA